MKLLIIIFSISFFVSCNSDEEEKQNRVDTKIGEISQKIDSVQVVMDSVGAEIDTVREVIEEPKKSPVLKDQSRTSISELWNTYKKSKSAVSKALERNDIETVVYNLDLAGRCAEQLGRMDIAAWQYNNVGHYSILEFKNRTDYDLRLQKLATTRLGKAKAEYQRATKILFQKEYPLLEKAEEYLVRAQIIDDELEPSRRTNVIQSNLDYIEWVKNFTGITESL